MNDYKLQFDNYCWRGNENTAPNVSGIYCVYSCVKQAGQFFVSELLYIGQAGDLRQRLSQHTTKGDFDRELVNGKVVFYTWALVDGRSLNACEAAMIYHFQPPYNQQCRNSFTGHGITSVESSGRWAFRVSGLFTQEPTV